MLAALALRSAVGARFGVRSLQSGSVKWFSPSKGYGFVMGEDGTDYFVHHSNVNSSGYRILYDGESVRFDIKDTDKGPQAVNVSPPDADAFEARFPNSH